MMAKRLAAAAFVVLLAACSQKTAQMHPTPAPTMSVDFPLYGGSTVITSREWHETVTKAALQSSGHVFVDGPGTYGGHEVIAETGASMQELQAWMHGLEAKPPAGYTLAATHEDDAPNLNTYGVAITAFDNTVNGKHHGVLVLAIDPQRLQKQAGPMLGLITKYRQLPQFLRDPIDQQAKKNAGFTISDALSPSTPIGAALQALDQLRSSGQRGIVIVDAAKH